LEDVIEIRVWGEPGAQGSKAPKGRDRMGRVILVESSKKVKPWRMAVTYAAREACEKAGDGMFNLGPRCVRGPVDVEMIFTLPKPKSAKRGQVPATRPDLSKLVRSTEDALTTAMAYEDDGRIVRCVSSKVYPNEGVDALHIPGAVIRIRPHVGA